MPWASWLTDNPVTRAAAKVASAAKEIVGFGGDDGGGGAAAELDADDGEREQIVVFVRERKR